MDCLSEKLLKCGKLFVNWCRTHPYGILSQFPVQRVVAYLKKGLAFTPLELNLSQDKTWWKDASLPFKHLLSTYTESKNKRLAPKILKFCDYGCCSLRGIMHLVKKLASGRVVAFDVAENFFQFGKKMLGNLVEAKRPITGIIDRRIDNAIDMKVSFLFFYNISSHIHPSHLDSNVRVGLGLKILH